MEQRSEILRTLCEEAGCACLFDARMKDYTTFRIGGPAAVLLKPRSIPEICWIRKTLSGFAPIWFMGKGSNLLISDEGVSGIVVVLGSDFSKVELQADGETLVCEAGAPLMKLCRAALDAGLSGLEFAWGIPGTVGGGVYMNAGAYGGEMKDVVLWCEHVDGEGNLFRLSGEELQFSYRKSFYTGKSLCIVRAALKLQKGDPDAIRARMDELMEKRRSKQPLEFPSAGSTFKRPEGAYAAALIEECGLKGLRVGGAEVSRKHSGFLINIGNATCADVQELIRQVQETVFKKTGYRLEPEVGSFQ